MGQHVRPACQEMSKIKYPIHTRPLTVASYAPIVRLNIDFVGPVNTDTDSGYILVMVNSFT